MLDSTRTSSKAVKSLLTDEIKAALTRQGMISCDISEPQPNVLLLRVPARTQHAPRSWDPHQPGPRYFQIKISEMM